MLTSSKAWNQEKWRRWNWQAVVIGRALGLGKRNCADIVYCLSTPSSFLPKEHHFGSGNRWPVRPERLGLYRTPEGESLLISAVLMIPFPMPMTGLGMDIRRNPDQWDVKEISTGAPLCRVSLLFRRECWGETFLLCLWALLSACVTWNPGSHPSWEHEGSQAKIRDWVNRLRVAQWKDRGTWVLGAVFAPPR